MNWPTRWLLGGFGGLVALLTVAARPQALPFPETVAAGAKLVKVYGDDRLFEGPVWDPRGKALYVTAFGKRGSQILRLDAPGKVTVWLDRSEGARGTCLSLDGRLLTAQAFGRRIMSYDFGPDGPTDPQTLYDDAGLNLPTDLCQLANGTIFFTDPDLKQGRASAVYRLDPDGKPLRVILDVDLPIGIEASLDGKTLYVSDRFRKLWRSYPVLENGTIGIGKFFFNPKTANQADPAGITIDERGNLYFAGRGGVWVATPKGQSLGLIAVPEVCTSAAFGGEDGKTLYLTCRKKIYSLAMTVRGHEIARVP